MKMKARFHPLLIVLSCASFLITGTGVAGIGSKVRLHGILIAQACNLIGGDDDQKISFDPIMTRYLYQYERSENKRLNFHLTDCDVATIKSAKITFIGSENAALPGLLAVSGVSGVAIGLEDDTGDRIKMNIASRSWPLTPGANVLTLNAYVQAEAAAIRSKSITPGNFTAATTFKIEYQ